MFTCLSVYRLVLVVVVVVVFDEEPLLIRPGDV